MITKVSFKRTDHSRGSTTEGNTSSSEILLAMIEQNLLNEVKAETLAEVIRQNQDTHFTRSMKALKFADEVYRHLPGPGIPLRSTQKHFDELCFSKAINRYYRSTPDASKRAHKLADCKQSQETLRNHIPTNRNGILPTMAPPRAYTDFLQTFQPDTSTTGHLNCKLTRTVSYESHTKSSSTPDRSGGQGTKDTEHRTRVVPVPIFNSGLDPLCLAFSCLAYLQTGEFDVDPQNFKDAMAIAYEDSMYVAEKLLADPCDAIHNNSIRRIVGNIGKSGLAILVPRRCIQYKTTCRTCTNDETAAEPIIRKDELKLVDYCPFDGHFIDSFASTSLHLRLTGSETPVSTTSLGEIQPESMMLETLIQVYDRGNWVADIDILGALRSVPPVFVRWPSLFLDFENRQQYESLVTMDSWDELLDTPPDNAIVRTSGNYLARIATCKFYNALRRSTSIARSRVFLAVIFLTSLEHMRPP